MIDNGSESSVKDCTLESMVVEPVTLAIQYEKTPSSIKIGNFDFLKCSTKMFKMVVTLSFVYILLF